MTDELTEFILDRLTTDGYVTSDYIMGAWLDVAAIRMHERLNDLKEEGKIRSDATGMLWRLKKDRFKPLKYPVPEEVWNDGS